ncbi:MAG: hypothetical protein M0Q88_00770 [Bacilli bacterium]|nr:hypothetical protein [Bacilli bacterium]
MAKKTTIRCPHCNAEYLPAEIYYPNEFLGKPFNIIKDGAGNILGYNGDDMNTEETYRCDNCDKPFNIDASVTFRTTSAIDIFEEDEFDIPEK